LADAWRPFEQTTVLTRSCFKQGIWKTWVNKQTPLHLSRKREKGWRREGSPGQKNRGPGEEETEQFFGSRWKKIRKRKKEISDTLPFEVRCEMRPGMSEIGGGQERKAKGAVLDG